MKFRPEIEGLRAMAVLAVLVFHLDASWMPGGFLGVDVFFVLSGFLITGLIRSQQRRGSFSLRSFWMRRIRRLFPALLLMVTAVLFVGGLVLIQPERDALGWQAFASLFSFANILFWRTTGGYWDNASENIALLHAWTLSLEEQFYLVYPLLLLALAYLTRGRRKLAIATLGLLSFALCVALTPWKTQASFFLLPTRMWELLLGGYLALADEESAEVGSGRWTWLRSLGLAMVLASFSAVPETAVLPGAYPLLPCLGTYLLLRYGRPAGPVHDALSWGPFAWVGRISYSLYLWHWPIVVFFRYLDPEPRPVLVALLSFALASASFYVVERPFHRGFRNSDRWIAALLVLPLAGFLWLAAYPVSPLMPDSLAGFDSERALSRGWEYEATDELEAGADGIRMGSDEGPAVAAVTGSSHARVLCPAFDDYLSAQGLGGVSLATSNLPLISDPSDRRRDAINRARLEALEKLRPRVVVVAGLWSGEAQQPDFSQRFAELLTSMADSSERVVVMGQVPVIDLPDRYRKAMRKYLLAKAITGQPLDLSPRLDSLDANQQVAQVVADVVRMQDRDDIVFVDAYPLLVDDQGHMRLRHDGSFLFSNYHHVNDDGSEYLFDRLFRPILEGLPQEDHLGARSYP